MGPVQGRTIARMLRMGRSARRGRGMVVIVDGVGFKGAACLLFFELDLSASDDFGFALTVGGLGFLEDVDKVLALESILVSTRLRARKVRNMGVLTVLTAFPDLSTTAMV